MADMRSMVAGLGGQVRAATGVRVPDLSPAGELLVVGMGGSGIGGDYLAHLASLHGARVTGHKSYGLPGWVASARPTVLAVSYSGNTEETLSAVDAAVDLGLPIIVVTTGGALGERAGAHGWPVVAVPAGLQPRAALGHLLGAALMISTAVGLVPSPVPDLEEAADVVDSLTSSGGAGWALAGDLAGSLAARAVIVYGSTGLTASVAQRWKTQINENGKRPAWFSVFPELDHNEIVGWSADRGLNGRLGVVTLADRDDGADVAQRRAITREVTAKDVDWIGEVHSQGNSALARMMSLTAIGDMVSVALAEVAGIDPVPVAPIEDLKNRLREER